MINNIVKWGVIGGIIMVVIFFLSYLIFPLTNADAYKYSTIMGYAGILIGIMVIYLAIAEYFTNEKTNSGIWPRITLGLAVAFLAGIIVGLYNILYVLVIDPNFMDDYLAFSISQLPTQSGIEFDKQVIELTQQKQAFEGLTISFTVMAASVWLIGIPATLISAFIHKRITSKNPK